MRLPLVISTATILPMCGRYASFPPAEAMARIFGTVNPMPAQSGALLEVAPTNDCAVARRQAEGSAALSDG
jgi:hypothetical protein